MLSLYAFKIPISNTSIGACHRQDAACYISHLNAQQLTLPKNADPDERPIVIAIEKGEPGDRLMILSPLSPEINSQKQKNIN